MPLRSLGGGLAAIYSAQLATQCLNLTTYSYGEPRTGNAAFASFIDEHFTTQNIHSTRYFRVTHANDGIVPIVPISDGYLHHGLELWSNDPPSPSNTSICPPEGYCCEVAGGTGINDAHVSYFGVSSFTCSTTV